MTINTDMHVLPLTIGKSQHHSTKILSGAVQVSTSARLIRLGARSILVQQLTGITDVKVRSLSHELGLPPIKGQIPSNKLWFARSPNRAEAIHFYTNFLLYYGTNKAFSLNKVTADIFIRSYERYIQYSSKNNKMDINRAWHLLDCLEQGLIEVVKCDSCHGIHLSMDSDPSGETKLCVWCQVRAYRHCPSCGKRHEDMVNRIPLTYKTCLTCKIDNKRVRRLSAKTEFV